MRRRTRLNIVDLFLPKTIGYTVLCFPLATRLTAAECTYLVFQLPFSCSQYAIYTLFFSPVQQFACDITQSSITERYEKLLSIQTKLLYRSPAVSHSQKYNRLRCLLRVKGLLFCFYLGWSGSILQFRQNIIMVGSKSWLLTGMLKSG